MLANATLARVKQVGELAPARLAEAMDVSAWTPRRLNPVLWLSTGKGLYQDAAGTVPAVGDNDPVGRWADEVTGIAATQAAAGSKPVLKPGVVNGRAVVRFDGADDILGGPDGPFDFGLGDHSVTSVVYRSSPPVDVSYWVGNLPNSNPWPGWHVGMLPTGRVRGRWRSDGVNADAEGLVNLAGAWCCATILRSSGTGYLFTNGSQENTIDASARNVDGAALAIGAERTGTVTNIWAGDVAELLIFNRALATSERQRVERYFASQYGITLA